MQRNATRHNTEEPQKLKLLNNSNELKGDRKLLADTCGGTVDFTDRSASAPLVALARNLEF